MHDRSALGPADVDDAALAAMVGALLGVGDVELLSSVAEPVPYEIPAITTAGRWWVSGTVLADGTHRPFRLFAKHVQSWSRSPFFAQVPAEVRPFAATMVPWRTEGEVYRSDLAAQLPDGLRMPRAVGVVDVDELSHGIWLEAVPAVDVEWDVARYTDAARVLGRFAAAAGTRARADVGGPEADISGYFRGRLTHQVLPMLADDDLWHHPLVAATFADLRAPLQQAAERVDAAVEEFQALPVLVGHGDACPNNLLVTPGQPGFTLIDFGFLAPLPVGFDLGQLLVGDVQIGRRSTGDLAERGEACLTAYREGLAEEGFAIGLDELRRAHAVHLLLFTALSSLPVELLGEEPSDDVRATAATRATVARHVLDLVETTG